MEKLNNGNEKSVNKIEPSNTERTNHIHNKS